MLRQLHPIAHIPIQAEPDVTPAPVHTGLIATDNAKETSTCTVSLKEEKPEWAVTLLDHSKTYLKWYASVCVGVCV